MVIYLVDSITHPPTTTTTTTTTTATLFTLVQGYIYITTRCAFGVHINQVPLHLLYFSVILGFSCLFSWLVTFVSQQSKYNQDI